MMNETAPLVSVLMPCYNAESFLHEAIDSIINQTYKNLEILLIDDGSSDRTSQIISEYAEKDARICFIANKVNLGLIRTLNLGIEKASGEFIARMDADDISELSRIEKIVEVFNKKPELDIVSAGYYYLSDDGKKRRIIYPKAIHSPALSFVSFFSIPVVHACIIVKSVVIKNNLFDESFMHSEDYELFSRLLFKGFKFYNVSEPLYYVRRNRGSVSHKYEKIQIVNHSRISQRNIEMYFDCKYEYFIHKIMINRISFNVFYSQISEAFFNLDALRNVYIEREKCEKFVKDEIDEFLTELKMDIMIQSFKYSNFANKISLVIFILKNISIFTCKRGRQYLRSKVW